MTLHDAAARLDDVEDEIDEVLASLNDVDDAVEELREAHEALAADPHDAQVLNDLQTVAMKHHTGYGDESGVVSRLNGTIEELAGPADELRGTLDVDGLFNELTAAFDAFDAIAMAFTWAKSSTVATPVGGDFLSELEDRLDEAPDRLDEVRSHLEAAKGEFPDPQEANAKLNDARRERELEEARRMREMMDDSDE